MSSRKTPADEIDTLVTDVHRAGFRFVIAATGGGSQAVAALLTVPGGSRTVLAALVPYSAAALTEFLHARPEQFCSEYTARLMAVAAFERARDFAAADEQSSGAIAGIGCTASLVSERPKRGAHRVHVAAQTLDLTAVASLELVKGARTRGEEEHLAAQMVLNLVARACGLSDRLALALRAPEQMVEAATVAPPEWRRLYAAETELVLSKEPAAVPPAEGAATPPSAAPGAPAARRLIFAGAFHPLHEGHREMARVAAAQTGAPIEWELSIVNVEKPRLDYHEMRLRSEQFPADAKLWFTRAPTFVEKARLFPGATFIVGADTMRRIAEPRFYGGDARACEQALAAIAAAGCRFLVFGRKAADRFETLGDLRLPPMLRAICDEVAASAFRSDVSSTEMRQAGARDE